MGKLSRSQAPSDHIFLHRGVFGLASRRRAVFLNLTRRSAGASLAAPAPSGKASSLGRYCLEMCLGLLFKVAAASSRQNLPRDLDRSASERSGQGGRRPLPVCTPGAARARMQLLEEIQPDRRAWFWTRPTVGSGALLAQRRVWQRSSSNSAARGKVCAAAAGPRPREEPCWSRRT